MSWTLTTSGAAIIKAGANANSDIVISGAHLAIWSDQAEGKIVADTRRDWVVDYAGLPTDVKNVLNDVASSLIAKQIISYDMSGFTSRTESQTMLNIQDDVARDGLRFLRDFKSNTIKTP